MEPLPSPQIDKNAKLRKFSNGKLARFSMNATLVIIARAQV